MPLYSLSTGVTVNKAGYTSVKTPVNRSLLFLPKLTLTSTFRPFKDNIFVFTLFILVDAFIINILYAIFWKIIPFGKTSLNLTVLYRGFLNDFAPLFRAGRNRSVYYKLSFLTIRNGKVIKNRLHRRRRRLRRLLLQNPFRLSEESRNRRRLCCLANGRRNKYRLLRRRTRCRLLLRLVY